MRRLILATLFIGVPAFASSDLAWKQGMAQATSACLKASELKGAAIAGQQILFSDDAGKTALLVTGRWRAAHMKNARTTMLCLYDRRSRKAETQEALNWSVKPR